MDGWRFPCARDVALNAALVVLHCSLNHGAKCLAHLFGFLCMRDGTTVMTPASIAWVRRNYSMASARSSLLASNLAAVAMNASVNAWDDVWVFHFAALAPYSCRHSPGIQRYAFVSTLPRCVFTGGDVSAPLAARVGWPAVPSEAVTTGMGAKLGSRPCRCARVRRCGGGEGGMGARDVSGRWVNMRSWSVYLNSCWVVCLTCKYDLLHSI